MGRSETSDPMSDGYWLKVQDERVAELESAGRAVLDAWEAGALTSRMFGPMNDLRRVLDRLEHWCCECGDLNRPEDSGCYRCGAGRPDDA